MMLHVVPVGVAASSMRTTGLCPTPLSSSLCSLLSVTLRPVSVESAYRDISLCIFRWFISRSKLLTRPISSHKPVSHHACAPILRNWGYPLGRYPRPGLSAGLCEAQTRICWHLRQRHVCKPSDPPVMFNCGTHALLPPCPDFVS